MVEVVLRPSIDALLLDSGVRLQFVVKPAEVVDLHFPIPNPYPQLVQAPANEFVFFDDGACMALAPEEENRQELLFLVRRCALVRASNSIHKAAIAAWSLLSKTEMKNVRWFSSSRWSAIMLSRCAPLSRGDWLDMR